MIYSVTYTGDVGGDLDYWHMSLQYTLDGANWVYAPNGGSLQMTQSHYPIATPIAVGTTIPTSDWRIVSNESSSDSLRIEGVTQLIVYSPAAGYQKAVELKPGQSGFIQTQAGSTIRFVPLP